MTEITPTEGTNRTPEQIALEKVVNIYETPMLKHVFHRHNPQLDIREEHMPALGRRDIETDRLRSILQYGLMSDSLAREKGIPYSRNWGDPINDGGISVFTEDATFDLIGIQAGPQLETILRAKSKGKEQGKIPAEEAFALLIDPSLTEFKPGHSDREKIFKEIPREALKGVIIFDNAQYISKGFGERFFDSTKFDPEFLTQEIVALMKECFGDNSHLYIPIYGFFGNLHWPKEMTKQEIESMKQ